MAQANPIDIQKALSGAGYPASRGALLDFARSNGASDDVLDVLSDLPDREYETPADLMSAFSEE